MKKMQIAALIGVSFSALSSSFAVDFAKDIQPVLEVACIRCHGEEKKKGDARLDTREALLKGGDNGPSIVVGKPDESYLIELLTLPDGDPEAMPSKGDRLTEEEVAAFKEWIQEGAPWPAGLVLEARKKVPTREAKVKFVHGLPAKEAAAIIDSALSDANKENDAIVHARQIDDLTFMRRVSVDLIGRIPTYTEIREYEAWPAAERRVKLIDKLLKHERFGERWMVFFADMMRIRSNADGGGPLLAYVRQSINEGKPYDQFVRELISATGAAPSIGFILGDGGDPLELAASTSQTFLGVQIGCAMCHDHPFDDWKQKEFYELASYFGKVERRENNFSNKVFVIEEKTNKVMWPPEREQPKSREVVEPNFPFLMAKFTDANKPAHIKILDKKRNGPEAAATKESSASLDNLLDGIGDATQKKDAFDADLKKAKSRIDIKGDLYGMSKMRTQLAELITSPRNSYFPRAFANRVWNELIGRGFVEPLDNFSDYNAIYYPDIVEFIGQDFVANEYNFRNLVKTIMLTQTYSRGRAPGEATVTQKEKSERAFTVYPDRRMLSEVLYDSIVQTGHIFKAKWPAGANIKTIKERKRVYVDDEGNELTQDKIRKQAREAVQNGTAKKGSGSNKMAMQQSKGYEEEEGEALDFDKMLDSSRGGKDDPAAEMMAMKAKSDQEIEAEAAAQAMMERANARRKYKYVEYEREIDDNPSYRTAMRQRTPAAPANFMRVFGQIGRDVRGQFRDENSSMRQALMMLNGRMTNEAARVGSLEPMYKLLKGKAANQDKAIEYAYLSALTRRPTTDEVSFAKELMSSDSLSGMADLRWALLNSHEFR